MSFLMWPIGILSLIVVFGAMLVLIGGKLGTSQKLWKSEKKWHRKAARFGFNNLMPAGIMIIVGFLPLIIVVGLATFFIMLVP